MSLEYEEIKRFTLRCLNSSIAQNILEYIFHIQERVYYVLNFGMTARSSP